MMVDIKMHQTTHQTLHDHIVRTRLLVLLSKFQIYSKITMSHRNIASVHFFLFLHQSDEYMTMNVIQSTYFIQ